MTTSNHSDDDQEMSMDEILASIRRYVSSDEPEKKPTAKHEDLNVQRASPILTASRNDDVVRLNEPKPVEPIRPSILGDDHFTRKALNDRSDDFRIKSTTDDRTKLQIKKTVEAPSDIRTTQQELSAPELISDTALASTIESFARLRDASLTTKPAATTQPANSSSNPTLDQLFETLARPMIREWLNTNLPQMVERMVLKEIQRITNPNNS